MRVDLELASDYEFRVKFPGPWPELATDEPAPLGEGGGPNPAMMLAGAVGNCLAASLLFCLRKARATPGATRASSLLTLARNERGRWRVAKVDVEITVEVPDADAAKLERCKTLFQDFCIVTESVRAGIPVDARVLVVPPLSAPSSTGVSEAPRAVD